MVTTVLRILLAMFLFAFWFFGMAFFGAPKAGLIIGGVAFVLIMIITKPKQYERMQAPDLRGFVQTLKVKDEESIFFETHSTKKEALHSKEGKR